MSQSRYCVGIDLGTTNCVLAYVVPPESDSSELEVHVLPLPQLVVPGSVESRTQLPSFLYLPHVSELRPEEIQLPWRASGSAEIPPIVGVLARNLGAKTPIRLVSSAKSWLSHETVDRRGAILPVHAPDEVTRVSPLEASISYLRHLRDAWNSAFVDAPLDEQTLIITVPASFDPGARELTVEAARALGLDSAVLLEEPQAALYNWIQASQGNWRNQVKPGETLLVIDVGGGTTDFSLIAAREESGNLVLERVAIGNHILLGGDNMDLALAYAVRSKLEADGKRLEAWQVQALTHATRDAKEALLSDQALEEVPIVVPSRGSSLIGGVLRTSLTREEVERIVLDGFFPRISLEEQPLRPQRGGLTTLALPYAADARITAHLAAFLARQRQEDGSEKDFLTPSAILLNGGVFRAEVLAERLLEVLNGWMLEMGAPRVQRLSGIDLDLAVARGAAYYASVRQGRGVRIRGGTAQAYYVGVESAMPAVPGFLPPLEALCIAPFGMEEGSEVTLEGHEFGLVVGEAVHFRFFSSKVRRHDVVGNRLELPMEGEIDELASIELELPPGQHQKGDVVPVFLAAKVTEVGTLELEAVAREGGQRWKVEFEVRGHVN